MTRKRSSLHTRARELQAESEHRLLLGQARELALAERTLPTAAAARAALQELAGDPGIAETWRERLRQHLVQAADPTWPRPEQVPAFTADLAAVTGERPREQYEQAITVPMTLQHTWLPHLRVAMAAVHGRRNLAANMGWWFGGPREPTWSGDAPIHPAAQQFVYAAAVSLAGPLRHLLRTRYGFRAASTDDHYRLLAAPQELGAVGPDIFDDHGLWLRRVPYPRPRNTEPRFGSFQYRTAAGRLDLARAFLADALGGTDPGSPACCPLCAGTGWLVPLHQEGQSPRQYSFLHTEAVPGPEASGPTCLCGPCHGTGLLPLPAQQFAAEFLTFPVHQWTMPRQKIRQWALAHLPQIDLQPCCGPGLQVGYVRAVVRALTRARIRVDMRSGPGYSPEFDWRGDLSAWIVLREDPCTRRPGLLMWDSTRGWEIAARGNGGRSLSGLRRLCPLRIVPSPAELVRALSVINPAGEELQPEIDLLPADPYTEVLQYLGGDQVTAGPLPGAM